MPAAPVNTAAPTISGSTVSGSLLTCSPGTWTGYPAPTFSYQWYAGASAISGATSSTYTTLVAQEGQVITCRVTASNASGTPAAVASNGITVTSAPVVPANTVAPSITGTPSPGSTLTANPGTWTGSPFSYAYQWIRDGVDESGQTANTYTAPASGTIAVRVTATGSGGTGSPATSAGVVISSLSAPVNTVAPVISGSAVMGSVLTTSDGTWTGSPAPTFAYQWKRNGADIGGATSQTYTTSAPDFSAAITCTVTATNSQGNASATSNSITVTL